MGMTFKTKFQNLQESSEKLLTKKCGKFNCQLKHPDFAPFPPPNSTAHFSTYPIVITDTDLKLISSNPSPLPLSTDNTWSPKTETLTIMQQKNYPTQGWEKDVGKK